MTQSTDNVYLSISFTNIPRTTAEEIVRRVEQLAGDVDFSVDYGDPIGDASPTPVADEAADAVGGDPTAPDSSDPDTDNLPPVVEPTPVVPTEDPAPTDAEPAPAGATDSPVDASDGTETTSTDTAPSN